MSEAHEELKGGQIHLRVPFLCDYCNYPIAVDKPEITGGHHICETCWDFFVQSVGYFTLAGKVQAIKNQLATIP